MNAVAPLNLADRIQVARGPAAPQALAKDATASPDKTDVGTSGVLGFLGKTAATVAGGAIALPAANLATSAAQTVGGLSTQFALAALPQIKLAPQLIQFLNAMVSNGVVLGALGGLAAGIGTGALLGLFAASSAGTKVDDAIQLAQENQQVKTQGAAGRFFAPMKASGNEIANHARDMHGAKSFGEALKSGAAMGSTFGDHVGGVTGRIQGGLMGAGFGLVGALPVALGVASIFPAIPALGLLAVAAPVVIGGGLLGAKLGEPVGQVIGSAAGAAAGAVVGTVYHAGHSLIGAIGGGGEEAKQAA